MMGGDGRATLGGIFSLWVLYRYLSWGGAEYRCVFVSLPASTPVDSTPPRPAMAWSTRGSD